jgi:hypothetical protein
MPTVRQEPESFTRSAVCTPKQWQTITTLVVLVCWAFIDQSFFAYAADAADITAEEIVEKADRIRFPAEGFQVDIRITTTGTGGDPEIKEYRVLSKGNERTLLQTTAPVIDRGTILLMRDHDLWVFLPNISQPVRLPLSQRLTGEVANGDLARANFAGDYEPTLLRTETLDKETYYVLELKAARRGVTYNRVLYWVNKSNYRPYKAEFFSLSKRLIKTCLYQGYQKTVDMERPLQLVMIDALNTENRSVLDYSNMQLRNMPDKVFTKDYLKKLSK